MSDGRLTISSKLSIDKGWFEQNQRALVALLVMFILLPIGFGAGTISIRVFDKVKHVYTNINSVSSNINASLREARASVQSWIKVHHTNIALQNTIATLEQEIVMQKTQLQQLDELKTLLKIREARDKVVATGKVILTSGSGYLNYATIDVGRKHGVSPGQLVMAQDGIVGRILEVQDNISTVLPITSPDSRISGWLQTSKQRMLLSGSSHGKLAVKFLDGNVVPTLGEMVVTTGDEGYFKPNLIIGKVSKVISENNIVVTPIFDLNKISYATVIEK